MPMQRKTHGLLAVKLTEIPIEERMRAARRAARAHPDEEPTKLLLAAICPSDNVYFVRAQAAGELPAAA